MKPGTLQPATALVCDMFDLTVLMEQGDEHGSPVYAIGRPQELAAGLRHFTLSPYFQTLHGLEAWCEHNLDKLRTYADSDEPIPDASNWN